MVRCPPLWTQYALELLRMLPGWRARNGNAAYGCNGKPSLSFSQRERVRRLVSREHSLHLGERADAGDHREDVLQRPVVVLGRDAAGAVADQYHVVSKVAAVAAGRLDSDGRPHAAE